MKMKNVFRYLPRRKKVQQFGEEVNSKCRVVGIRTRKRGYSSKDWGKIEGIRNRRSRFDNVTSQKVGSRQKKNTPSVLELTQI